MYKVIGVQEVEQPIYKIQQRGTESLPDEELLALVLRIPQRDDSNVLAKLRGFLKRNPLHSLADFQLETPPGQIVNRQLKGNDLTKAQLLTLKAVIEFARRVLDRGMGTEPRITTPIDVLPELRDIKDKTREYFVTVFLNARNQIINTEIVSVGSLSASLVHPREVFAPAVAFVSSKCDDVVILIRIIKKAGTAMPV